MEHEDAREIGLLGFEKAAQIEGEGAERQQEDSQEDIGRGRQEIAAQLAQEHGRHDAGGAGHVAPPNPWGAARSAPPDLDVVPSGVAVSA